MKSEKGLTFLATTVLVVVIAAITFAVVYFTRMQVNKEKAEGAKNDMLRVQAKITTISGNYLKEKKEDLLVGTKLSEMKEENSVKEFLEKKIINADEKGKKYYVLDQESLNNLELGKITLEEGSYYIAEYTSGDVYYTKGYTDENGEVYYKIKDIEEVNHEENAQNEQKEESNENKENKAKEDENKKGK